MAGRLSRGQKTKGSSKTPIPVRIPVKVQEGEGGVPQAVLVHGRWETVKSVVEIWDVSETLMGEKRMIKSYFEIITNRASSLRLFLNKITGSWYLEEPVPEG